MNIIPLNSYSKKFRNKNRGQSKDIRIEISEYWWTSDFSLKNNDEKTHLNHRSNKNNLFLGNIENSHSKWNVNRGDHRVSEPFVKDYVYYRELKSKILRFIFYPFLFISVFFIYSFLNFLSEIKF